MTERILALDVGDKTIGVAISDELLFTAQGVETIHRDTIKKDLQRLREHCQNFSVKKIVVGLPKNMNGSEGTRCQMVRKFAQQIETSLQDLHVQIIFWDERLSTVAMEKELIGFDLRRKKRKQVIDKMAAIWILQGYLQSLV